jgi:hypothetical protein
MSGAPPFRLPGTHFAGAIVWLLFGGAGLVAVAPDLAAAGFLSPRVLAVTHLYTADFPSSKCRFYRRRRK